MVSLILTGAWCLHWGSNSLMDSNDFTVSSALCYNEVLPLIQNFKKSHRKIKRNRTMLRLFLRLSLVYFFFFFLILTLISVTLTLKTVEIVEISDFAVVLDKQYLDLVNNYLTTPTMKIADNNQRSSKIYYNGLIQVTRKTKLKLFLRLFSWSKHSTLGDFFLFFSSCSKHSTLGDFFFFFSPTRNIRPWATFPNQTWLLHPVPFLQVKIETFYLCFFF